nr:DUF3667 domain-containing protein [uncultured Flavobacterium sp.]
MNCLNCNSEVTGSYCFKCGQKTSTARFSFQHIFKNDIASQYYSFIKNPVFFTLKELATRPGDSIREYLLGKRVNHMNYMSLFLMLSGIGILIDKYTDFNLADVSTDDEAGKKLLAQYFEFVRDNPKTYIAITIPIVAVFTFLFFKKSKFNFSEHLILNIYKASALLVLAKIVSLFSFITSNLTFLKGISQIVEYGALAYSFWFIYQFFNDNTLYSRASIITRTSFAVVLGLLFSTLFMFIYWLIVFALNAGKV